MFGSVTPRDRDYYESMDPPILCEVHWDAETRAGSISMFWLVADLWKTFFIGPRFSCAGDTMFSNDHDASSRSSLSKRVVGPGLPTGNSQAWGHYREVMAPRKKGSGRSSERQSFLLYL